MRDMFLGKYVKGDRDFENDYLLCIDSRPPKSTSVVFNMSFNAYVTNPTGGTT